MVDIVDPPRRPETTERGERQGCAFCSFRDKLTDEHIWPERFQKIFTNIQRARHRRGQARDPAEQHHWDADAFTATARIDCNKCNNTHLERIEREAVPWSAGWRSERKGRHP